MCCEADMLALAGLICGFVFGWGLLISGMMQPAKVLAFLDIFGAWDPSLLVVMVAALAVGSTGYAFARPRTPLFAPRNLWPEKATIDAPLVAGAALFGVGWGLTGSVRARRSRTLRRCRRAWSCSLPP